jgi:hypothetical protein
MLCCVHEVGIVLLGRRLFRDVNMDLDLDLDEFVNSDCSCEMEGGCDTLFKLYCDCPVIVDCKELSI